MESILNLFLSVVYTRVKLILFMCLFCWTSKVFSKILLITLIYLIANVIRGQSSICVKAYASAFNTIPFIS